MSFSDNGSTLNAAIPRPVTYVVASFLSVAIYNVVELTLTLFLTFKRRHGLYFWSFLVATWGIAIYAIGFLLKDFNLATSISYFYVTLIVIGWSMMVTGQSMVLYSRLHLIVHNQLILRLVLAMIITNAIVLHIPTSVLCYGANSPSFSRFAVPYAVYERAEVSVFFVQEIIISGIYVYETYKMFHSENTVREIHGDAGKKLFQRLLLISLLVIVLDICVLVLEFAGRYVSQTAVKGFIYSVKLKLEFRILNQLVEFVRRASIGSLNSIDLTSDSRNCLESQQGEGNATAIPHQHCNCALVLFARKMQYALGISVEKYAGKIFHSSQRKAVVQEGSNTGSTMTETGPAIQSVVN